MTPEDKNEILCFKDLVFANPFLSERQRLEEQILGSEGMARLTKSQRLRALVERAAVLEQQINTPKTLRKLPAQLKQAGASLALFCLFHELIDDLDPLIQSDGTRSSINRRAYRKLTSAMETRKSLLSGTEEPAWTRPEHLFACFFQLRRAFHYIHSFVIGESRPMEALRGRIWESVFTKDMRSFQLWMHRAVGRFPTLILGPSGSGKELVARAIGQSRFLAYNPSTHLFENGSAQVFHPVNLAALSPTVVESELFGHVRGSFTGAHADRAGLFETCGNHGAVFLDEIGEISGTLQVKLLRLLQSGEFQRIGESTPRYFSGKIIAATNRNLTKEMQQGRFREDLFYRICGDQVHTPALNTILGDDSSELKRFVTFVCDRLFGGEASQSLGPEIFGILQNQITPEYSWPGNFRELEQAIRNIVVTGSYSPIETQTKVPIDLLHEKADIPLSEWIRLYAQRALRVHGSRRKAAAALQIDPRTLASHLE